MFLKDSSKKKKEKKEKNCVCLHIFAKRNTGRKKKENGVKMRGLRTGGDRWIWSEISLSTFDSFAF